MQQSTTRANSFTSAIDILSFSSPHITTLNPSFESARPSHSSRLLLFAGDNQSANERIYDTTPHSAQDKMSLLPSWIASIPTHNPARQSIQHRTRHTFVLENDDDAVDSNASSPEPAYEQMWRTFV